MIDTIKTFAKYGYHATDLTPKSHKLVVATCDQCHTDRNVDRSGYRDLCRACAHSGPNLSPTTRKRMRKFGIANPFWGKRHSKKTKQEISTKLVQCTSLQPGEAAHNKVVSYYIRNARKKGLEFILSPEIMDALFKGDCHYCGIPPSTSHCHGGNGVFIFNGIDRIDNTKGYVESNVVSCCGRCNMTKRNLPYQDFLDLIAKIFHHTKRNNHD